MFLHADKDIIKQASTKFTGEQINKVKNICRYQAVKQNEQSKLKRQKTRL